MRNCIYLLLFIFLSSCSSVKRSENNLSKGNYDEAIRLSIKKIQKSRNKKSDQQHIQLLEAAFQKATSRDIARVQLLEKENNTENTKEIFETYKDLEYRQKLIRPLLPLQNATFKITDYSNAIVNAMNNYSDFLYAKGSDFLTNGQSIMDARTAHRYLSSLKKIQPNYQSLDSLLEEAHYQGTDFVHVVIQNRTEQVIPKRLEAAILDFDTYRLDNFWTEYHATPQKDVDYTYGIVLDIREILISPERINEKEFKRTIEVSDGWDYVLDNDGNVKKDSLGNDIKVDVFKELKAKVIVSNQFKSALVGGNVVYRDLKQNKNISQFPISSEFVFEHRFANYRGDKEALTKDDKQLVRRRYTEFPSNEQMVFDTSTDLKNKFARILKRRSFR
jgi:hypothetical protein